MHADTAGVELGSARADLNIDEFVSTDVREHSLTGKREQTRNIARVRQPAARSV